MPVPGTGIHVLLAAAGHPMFTLCTKTDGFGHGQRTVETTLNRHRLDGRGDLPRSLGHDHDPHRLDATTTSSGVGSIFGCHRHGWLLLLQLRQ
jgi:hypothetical protein